MPVPRDRREALLDWLDEAALFVGPEHTAAMASLRADGPTDEELFLLQDFVGDQLIRYGFEDDWEPNWFGRAMEDLLGLLVSPWPAGLE